MKNDPNSLLWLRGRAGYLIFASLTALAMLLTGCTERVEVPYLVVEDAYVVGPNSHRELHAPSNRSTNWDLTLSTGDLSVENLNGKSIVNVHPISDRGSLSINRPAVPSRASFEVVEILYQLNEGQERVLEPAIPPYDQEGGYLRRLAVLHFGAPDNLAHLLRSQGTSSVSGWIERVDDQKGDIHRLYIKYILDGEPYELDASFRIERSTVWYSKVGSFGGLP